MDAKTLEVLEFPKIIARLVGFAAFSASEKLARALKPTNDLALALERQARTSEARRLLSEHPQIGVGAAHDLNPYSERARRGGVLEPEEFLEIKDTLISARELARFFNKHAALYPQLASIAEPLPPPAGLIEAINRVLSEKGEVLDDASPALANIRKELKSAHERLLNKLQRIINDASNAKYLQEALITMRNGRYVVPLRAEHKRRFKSVIQDQSASGSTLFVEPLAAVDLNNEWIALQLKEREEIRRILAALTKEVGAHVEVLQAIVRALAALDMAFMCAKYGQDLRAVEPILNAFDMCKGALPDPILKLIHARHPLIDPQTVVPIDVALGKGIRTLVITGPNTGGKTVSLKTVGLLALMAQSGLHIPAQSGSQLCIFRDVFADIGDEQSIEQSLSTFSGHITNIVRILKKVRSDTLVLLDELGAGTDPQEGSAIARAILNFVVHKQAPALVATHYPELKAYAHTTSGVSNASVEFDMHTLQPTYHLIIGLPGRSNALSIAQRLGLSEQIVQDARAMIDPSNLRADDLLDEIHRQRELAGGERSAAEQLRKELEGLRGELQQRLDAMEEERIQVLEQARQEALDEIEAVRSELNKLRKMAAKAQPRKKAKPLKEKLEKLEEKVAQTPERVLSVDKKAHPLRVGDRVFVRSLKVDGYVRQINEEQLELEVGKMHLKVSTADVERSKKPAEKSIKVSQKPGRTIITDAFVPSPGSELQLRGMQAEEALLKLERYLDAAYAAGLPDVRVVHGKGTGTLRQLVREVLGRSPLVASWEPALYNEGGMGVTVAHMRSN